MSRKTHLHAPVDPTERAIEEIMLAARRGDTTADEAASFLGLRLSPDRRARLKAEVATALHEANRRR